MRTCFISPRASPTAAMSLRVFARSASCKCKPSGLRMFFRSCRRRPPFVRAWRVAARFGPAHLGKDAAPRLRASAIEGAPKWPTRSRRGRLARPSSSCQGSEPSEGSFRNKIGGAEESSGAHQGQRRRVAQVVPAQCRKSSPSGSLPTMSSPLGIQHFLETVWQTSGCSQGQSPYPRQRIRRQHLPPRARPKHSPDAAEGHRWRCGRTRRVRTEQASGWPVGGGARRGV